MIFKNKILFNLILSLLFSTYCFQSFGQNENVLINNYLKKEQVEKRLLSGDISDWIITDQYTDKNTSLTHVYIQQRHHGIVVFNAISNFLIKENKILYFKSGIVEHLERKVNSDQPVITARDAITFTLKHLKKESIADIQ